MIGLFAVLGPNAKESHNLYCHEHHWFLYYSSSIRSSYAVLSASKLEKILIWLYGDIMSEMYANIHGTEKLIRAEFHTVSDGNLQ